MKLYVPGYTYYEVGSLKNDPVLDVIHGMILHETGTQVSPREYFDGPSGGIESTLFIPKGTKKEKEQYRPLNREADANYKANSWIGQDGLRHGFLSCETQGAGDEPWTDYQLKEIKDLLLFTSDNCNYPLRKVGGPKGHGVGYHIQFDSWTNVSGKICPGAGKIEQYNDILVPWMNEVSQNKHYTTVKGDTVPSVAKKFDIEQWQLWRWNPQTAPPFEVGTVLRVKQ